MHGHERHMGMGIWLHVCMWLGVFGIVNQMDECNMLGRHWSNFLTTSFGSHKIEILTFS